MDLTKSIMELKGIGEKNAALFHKLNIETIEDLLYHFPKSYESLPPVISVQEAKEQQISDPANSENNACSRTCQESVYSEAAGRGCAWGTSSYLIF
jgi:RecG-like helicase